MKYLLLFSVLVAVFLLDSDADTHLLSSQTCDKNQIKTDLENWQIVPFLKRGKKKISLVEVTKKLQKKANVKLTKILTVQSADGFYVRSKLPFLKDYLEDVTMQFQKLDLKKTFMLLGRVGHVLRVAYAGCKEHPCLLKVKEVLFYYQDLITSSARFSKRLVKQCIDSLAIHKKAYESIKRNKFNKAVENFKRLISLIKEIMEGSEKVVTGAEKLRSLNNIAYSQVIEDLGISEDEKEKLAANLKEYEEKQKNHTEVMQILEKKLSKYEESITNLNKEIAKMDGEEEFLYKIRLLTPKCLILQTPTFEELCTEINTMFKHVRIKTCELKKGLMTRMECHDIVDSQLLQYRKQQLKNLSELQEKLRSERLDLEEKKLDIQLKQSEQFAELKKTGRILSQLKQSSNEKKHNLEFAKTSLKLSQSAVTIVQIQLKNLFGFWSHVMKQTTDIVSKVEGKVKYERHLKKTIIDSGFHWIALGEVLRKANKEMKNTEATIDEVLMKLPTSKEVKQVIEEESEGILRAASALIQEYDERIEKTKKRINELKCQKNVS